MRMAKQTRIEISLNQQTSGTAKFSSSHKLTRSKIKAVEFVTNNDNSSLSLNVYKPGAFNGDFFLNLFDDKENQFCFDAPLGLFSSYVWGRVLTFEPRYLSLNSCYVRFYGGLSTSRSIGLIIHSI